MNTHFTPKDIVNFKGNIDDKPLSNTILAFVNMQTLEAIIEYPDKHPGSEFSNRNLDPNKTYIPVKVSDLELVLKTTDEAEEITAEKLPDANTTTTEVEKLPKVNTPFITPVDENLEPLSTVLIALKTNRPASEHKMLDNFIERVAKEEEKNAKKAFAEETIATEKTLDETNAEVIAKTMQNNQVMADKLNADVIARRKQDEKEREQIFGLVQTALNAGILKYYFKDGIARLNDTKNFVLGVTEIGLEAFKTNPDVVLCNYLQNTPGDMIEFSTAITTYLQSKVNSADEIEKGIETGLDTKKTKPTKENSFKEKVLIANDKVKSTKNNIEDETEVAAPVKITFKDFITSLSGVGKAFAAKIINDHPTAKSLLDAIKAKKLPYTTRQIEILAQAVKTKNFKNLL